MSLIPVEPELAQRVPDKPVLRDDPKLASGKIAVFQYGIVGVFLFLISGFWNLQVRNPDLYSERAESNRIKAVPIGAPRGKILDRDGRVIVDSHSSYSVLLSRENLNLEHLRAIADGLNLDYADLAGARQPLPVAAQVRAHRHQAGAVAGRAGVCRSASRSGVLPRNGSLPRPEAALSAEPARRARDRLHRRNQRKGTGSPEFAKYEQGDIVGKAGIERQYNDILHGVDGQRRVVVDNLGHVRETTPPT